MTGPRLTFDGDGRVKPAKRVRQAANKWASQVTKAILDRCYPDLVPAVVIERAMREMAIRDELLTPKPQPRRTT